MGLLYKKKTADCSAVFLAPLRKGDLVALGFGNIVTKLGGGNPVNFFEAVGKVVAIVKATAIGNLRNRLGGLLQKKDFRLLETVQSQILAKAEAGAFFEGTGQMLTADRAVLGNVRQRNGVRVIMLHIGNSHFHEVVAGIDRLSVLFGPQKHNQQGGYVALQGVLGKIIGVFVLVTDLAEDGFYLCLYPGNSADIGHSRKQVTDGQGNVVLITIDQQTGMYLIAVHGGMENLGGDDNDHRIAGNRYWYR